MPSNNVLMKTIDVQIVKGFRLPGITFIIPFLLVSILLSSCNQEENPPSAEFLRSVGLIPIDDQRIVPNIEFFDESGTVHNLSEYRGKVILLNFWATWCPPCRAEMPSMEKLANALESSDFVMLAVNVQETQELVSAFAKEYEIKFPVFYDPEGRAAQQIGVSGLPTSLLIDKGGRAVAAVTGAVEWDQDSLIEAFLEWAR